MGQPLSLTMNNLPLVQQLSLLLFVCPSWLSLSLPCMNERLHPHAFPLFRQSRDLKYFDTTKRPVGEYCPGSQTLVDIEEP
jgi:hypothetical protein